VLAYTFAVDVEDPVTVFDTSFATLVNWVSDGTIDLDTELLSRVVSVTEAF
jgi:hypothetical protein